jgi:hypothetical protein
VTPELVAKVKAAIGDKPLVVPVAAEEAGQQIPWQRPGAGLRLGLPLLAQSCQPGTPHWHGWAGSHLCTRGLRRRGGSQAYLLVDDTLTQGGTFAALASHIREGGGPWPGSLH